MRERSWKLEITQAVVHKSFHSCPAILKTYPKFRKNKNEVMIARGFRFSGPGYLYRTSGGMGLLQLSTVIESQQCRLRMARKSGLEAAAKKYLVLGPSDLSWRGKLRQSSSLGPTKRLEWLTKGWSVSLRSFSLGLIMISSDLWF